MPFVINFKGEIRLEKLAVIKLNSDNIKLQFVKLIKNKSFTVYDEVSVPVDLTKDFYGDYIIKPAIIKEISSTLLVFKKMMDAQEITDSLCFATNILADAKNNNGFIDQIENVCGFKFKIVSPEEEGESIYTAIINTFNKPKGLVFNISNYHISFVHYNRRNIVENYVINTGYETLYSKYVEQQNLSGDELFNAIYNELKPLFESKEFITNLAEEYEVVGVGSMFINLAKVAIKAKKYPIDTIHNFNLNKTDFEKVFNAIKTQDISKSTKIKGVSLEDSKYLQVVLKVIDVFFSLSNKQEISVSRTGFTEGVLFNYVLPLTMEKPISDTLGYSLSVINDYYNYNNLNILKVYDISMILFKQLKVLHKLGRSYVKILRIASYLCNSGLKISVLNKEQSAFNIILNSNLYGVTHSELVLAAFVALLVDIDNFNLSDWVKYRDLITEDDLKNVKKLSVILRIAQSLDVTGFGNIEDINCDVLGDSVIMKTIVKDNADLEIKHASLASSEFKKAFNKNLEIL